MPGQVPDDSDYANILLAKEGHQRGGGPGGSNYGWAGFGGFGPGLGGGFSFRGGNAGSPVGLADLLARRRKLLQEGGARVAAPASATSAPQQGGYGAPMPALPAAPQGMTVGGYPRPMAQPSSSGLLGRVIRGAQQGQGMAPAYSSGNPAYGTPPAGDPWGFGLGAGEPPPVRGPHESDGSWNQRLQEWQRRNPYSALGPIGPALGRILGAGGAAGAFNPLGSPEVMAALEQKAASDAQARQRDATTAAQYFGGQDPALAGYSALSSYLGSQSDTANALNQARLQTMLGGQDYARNLLGVLLGAQGRLSDTQTQGAIQGANQPNQQGPPLDIGRILGGLGGLVGAF